MLLRRQPDDASRCRRQRTAQQRAVGGRSHRGAGHSRELCPLVGGPERLGRRSDGVVRALHPARDRAAHRRSRRPHRQHSCSPHRACARGRRRDAGCTRRLGSRARLVGAHAHRRRIVGKAAARAWPPAAPRAARRGGLDARRAARPVDARRSQPARARGALAARRAEGTRVGARVLTRVVDSRRRRGSRRAARVEPPRRARGD